MLKQVSVGKYAHMNTWNCFVYMYKHEGFYGFFKGNGVNVVRIAPFSAFEFYFYEVYKKQLFGGENLTAWQKLICGGLTGSTASTLTYPLDVIRTNLSVDTGGATNQRPSIFSCGKHLYREGGIRGLYRGLPSTLFGITPYIGFKMASFDILRTFFSVDKSHPYAQLMNLCLGGTAGTIALTLTYPTDVVRRLMQLSGTKGYPKYTSMLNCYLVTLKTGGIKNGLYKGYVAALLKVAPSMAIMFWCNEYLKSLLE